MSLDIIDSLKKELDTDDVGQKRYIMYSIFDQLLEQLYQKKNEELPDIENRIEMINGLDGYMYKLAQEFLTSSSTMEKEQKLEKMINRAERL